MKLILFFVFAAIVLTSCDGDPNEDLPEVPGDARVIIVGAGAAGLYAAKVLADNNVDFLILEASDEIGGRLKKNADFTSFPLDMGAEWIHGNRALTYQMTRDQDIEIFSDESPTGFWYDGQFFDYDVLPEKFDRAERYLSGDAINQPDETFREWSLSQGYDENDFSLLESLVNDTGGASDKVSLPNGTQEGEQWTAGSGDFKLRNQTYFDLIHDTVMPAIQDKILLNSPVTNIRLEGDKVLVTAGDETHEADRVIVTVSVNVLKKELIKFEPALEDRKKTAINQIGMDAGMKVYLKFDENFFETTIVGAEQSPFYYDAGYEKNAATPTLGLFITGRNAQELSDMPESDAIQAIIDELDIIHQGKASAHYSGEYIIQDWTKEPYVLGAYSYATVGMGNARAILAEPVQNKIFFAGEATHLEGHNSTVHGAMETGEREAINVIRSF